MKTTNVTDERRAGARQPRFGQRERDFVLAIAAKMLRDMDQAEDVAQQSMLLAYRHRASFRGDSLFTTWLHRIATTTALMHLRRKARERLHLDPTDIEQAEQMAAPGLDPEERMVVEEDVRRAGRGLAELAPALAAAVSMRFAEGYSTVEIGRRLGLRTEAAKSRVYRGRKELLARMAEPRP